jgi:hypothetical protein
LGLSSLRVRQRLDLLFLIVDVSQTVLGSGMGAFSILPSSKPEHLDLKVTSDLVRMRGHGGGRPKLDGVAAFSGHYVAAEP